MTKTPRFLSAPHLRLAVMALLTAAVSYNACAQDKPSEDVVKALAAPFVTVNGQAIPTAHAEVLFRERLAMGATATPELRESVRQDLINQRLMLEAARAQGLDRQPLIQAQMELASQASLVRQWQQKVLTEQPTSDEALQTEYRAQIAKLGPDELQIRHIVVADEDLAKQLIARARKGESFADLVVKHSTDEASRKEGGLTGWVPQGRLNPDVANAVAKLKPRQLALAPVRTPQGWHVIQLQDRRTWTPPSLDTLRPQLLELLARRTIDSQLQALRAKATIQ